VHSTRYIILFVLALTGIVALILSLMATGLKGIHDRNEAIYNKKAILSAIEGSLDTKVKELTDQDITQIFEQKVEQIVVDMEGNVISDVLAEEVDMAKERKKPEEQRKLPVYVYNGDAGKIYIVSVRGSGLWDEIWGSIALEDDLNTIAGTAFDHKGETPGLGAEIKDNPNFRAQFIGKKLYADDGDFESVLVRKGGAKNPVHEVDAITGATVTCDGVTEMLDRGIQYYQPYFESIK